MTGRRWLALALLVSLSIPAVSLAEGKAKGIQPFSGKDLSGWKFKGDAKRAQWFVGKAEVDPQNPGKLVVKPGGNEMINLGHSIDIYSEAKFGDAVISLEVMVPKGSNSGIYLMGEYEIQILDSFGKTQLGMGDMGAIYSASVPRVNASKAPGQWQKYWIQYQAPRFDAGGKKTANAKVIKILLNDQVIHENVEIKGPTGGALTARESSTGPLLFQGDHGPVAYRNIEIFPSQTK